MGRKMKITDEQLQAELKEGLTVEEIAEKHGMKVLSVKHKMARLGLTEKIMKVELKTVPAENCFAYNRFNGDCTCLTVGKCPGEKCGFYKEANQAMEEMRQRVGPGKAYAQNTQAAMMMVKRNQGVSA